MNKYACFFIILIALSACQSIDYVSIDYLTPSELSFPPELRRVGIVNNTSRFTERHLDTNEDTASIHGDIERSVAYPECKASITAESFAETLAKQNYFDEVIICDSALRDKDKFAREDELTQEEVQTLTKSLNVDFLIAITNVDLKAVKTFSFVPEYNCFYGNISMKMRPTLTVYLPKKNKHWQTTIDLDSIYWDVYGESDSYVRTHIISEKQMIEEASDYAGTIPVKHYAPYWQSIDRPYFAGGSVNMRDAAIYVKEKSWNKAGALWKKEYEESKSNKRKYYAAYNLILYYETQDSIETALQWAKTALQLAGKFEHVSQGEKPSQQAQPYCFMAAVYQTVLEQRNASLPLLNAQMNRFNDDF